MAAADDELLLLERVFLRVGSAETDEQLQNVLFKFLPPVLLKLASQTDGVRKKVMELLIHVNKRLKSRSQVQLPVPELLAQYTDPEISPFVTNFSILYIKMGYPRLEPSKQAELLPTLLASVEKRPQAQQDSLLQLVVRAIRHVKLPADAPKRCELFGMSDKPALQQLLLDLILDVILLPYNAPSAPSQPADGGPSPPPMAPPGLSEASYQRAKGETLLTAEELEKVKLSLLELLGADIFPEQDVVAPLVVATGDGRHSVTTKADRELKRITSNQDWNNSSIISKLFSVFQGTVAIKGKTPLAKPEMKRSPASIQVRMKIFPYLLKSRESVNHFPASVQVIFDCLFGTNTNTKLKHMAIQFVHHMTLCCTDAKFNPISAVLLSGLVKLIHEAKEDPKLRGLSYVAVGKVVSRAPQLVNKNMALLQTFMDAMTKEESDTRLAVQEALSLMASAFKNIDSANRQILEALIMQNIEKTEVQARLVAVQYAQAVFPPDHIPSRYILLLAAGDLKGEVYTEASKALRVNKEAEKSTMSAVNGETAVEKKLPEFTDMVKYIYEKGQERLKTAKKYVIGNNVLPFNPATYGEMLVYLRQCLAASAGVEPDLESVNAMRDQAPVIARYVSKLLKEQPGEKGPIGVYINIIRQLLTAIGGSPAMYCLLEVVAVARQQLAPQFIKHLDWIKSFMYSSREEMREYAAELFAVVITEAGTPSQHMDTLKEQSEAVKSQALEGQHGSLLALGHLIGGLCRHPQSRLGDIAMEDIETTETSEDPKRKVAIEKATKVIAGQLDSTQVLLSGGSCSALGEVGRNTALPLVDTSENNKVVSKLTLVEKLLEKVKSTKVNAKVREKAALCLGYLCVGEKTFPHRQKVIEGLLDCAEAKQLELHFTIGEALVYAALGPHSAAGRDMWAVTEEEFLASCGPGGDEVQHLLQLLLDKHVLSPNPHIRQAACIWLLSVARQCSKHAYVQKRFTSIQQAFMHLLADNDELTQDIASKGLGVVYENCGVEQKDQLVSLLIDTLTTGKRSVQTVTGDTKLFDDGALGKTPDGQSLSTYKELCSIANDLNQPDLIYKFMHLANHNAIWNSRKGAAFGFTTIAAKAGQQLAPHLGKILPKLFRYQFDPNPRINQAMSSIWTALVSDSKGMVDKYLREIMEDLLKNLTNNQWRIRESSCMAINDLLRGRALDDVIDHFEELWGTLFRVRDDIKESVRKAADIALKTLSRVSIKMSDTSYGKIAGQTTTAVLPILLKAGLGSQVDEVRAVALSTLLKMSKNAGPLLKPHIPVLVVALLEALSTLEHQAMNYLSLRVAGNQQTQDRLDNARIAASKTSPMMESINLCVQYVDGPVLAELVPRLTELIRSAVGLGTKAGCANFIISMTHQCPKDLAAHAGKLLAALLSGLNDRNPTIRRAYATCIGHLVKVAKDSSVEKLILKLKAWYLEKEDDHIHDVCGVALHAINLQNPDVLKCHATLALPLAFLAMHRKSDAEGESDHKVSVWEEVWLDATPGTEAGVRLYLPELTELTQVALQSQSWAMKAQAAAAMNTMATKLGGNLGPPQLGLLLAALISGLAGRTWTGKEALLQATKAVCVSCKDAVAKPENENQPPLDMVLDAVMKECNKEKLTYKMAALKCAGPILETHQVDLYKNIQDILDPLISKVDQPAKKRRVTDLGGAVEASDENKAEKHDVTRDVWLEFEACAYECLGQAWPVTPQTQAAFELDLCERLSSDHQASVWRVQVVILATMKKVISRSHLLKDPSHEENVTEKLSKLSSFVLPPVCQSLGNIKYVAVRTEALGVAQLLYDKLKAVSQLSAMEAAQVEQLRSSLEALQGDSSPELADKATTFYKAMSP